MAPRLIASIACTGCSRFFACRREEKSRGKGCVEFSARQQKDFLGSSKEVKKLDTPKEVPIKEEVVEDSYNSYFLQAGSEAKIQLPEEDFPLAKNVYEFIFGKRFLDSELYPKQLEIAIGYFQEYCPDCSNLAYTRNIPVGDTIDEVLFHITLLEHEICPKCNKTKIDFLREGKLKDYIELVGLAGQRCLKGDTLVLTDRGEVPIEVLVKERIKCSVLTHKGNWKPIVDWFDNGIKETVSLSSLDNQNLLVCTPTHRLLGEMLVGEDRREGFFEAGQFGRQNPNLSIYTYHEGQYKTTPVLSSSFAGTNPTYDITVADDHSYIANGYVVSNSGKSLVSAMFSMYTIHRYLKVPEIFSTFSLARSSPLHGTFIALNKDQVARSAWPHMQSYVRDSPWFSGYNEMLKYYGKKHGKILHDVSKIESFEYFLRNIKVQVATPDKRSLRGRTSIVGSIDEIGWFDSESRDKVKISADEVYTALSRSFLTVAQAYSACRKRGVLNIPSPTFISVSSPSHSRDKICSLVEHAKKTDNSYYFHYATWDINPTLPRDSSFIEDAYSLDPILADRDYGANPPLSSSAFIDNPSLAEEDFHQNTPNLVTINYALDGPAYQAYSFTINKSSVDNSRPRVLSLDLGYNNNSTALCIGYYDKQEQRVVVESLNEIIPGPNSNINFVDLIEHIIKPLVLQLNIQIVCADSWQIITMFQELEKKFKIKTLRYSLTYEDFQLFKQSLLTHKIQFPSIEDRVLAYGQDLTNYPYSFYNKPISHLLFQLSTVIDDKKSEDSKKHTVKKGERTTDDVFRTSVLMHYILSNYQYRDYLDQKREVSSRAAPLGYYVGIAGQRPVETNSRIGGQFGVLV